MAMELSLRLFSEGSVIGALAKVAELVVGVSRSRLRPDFLGEALVGAVRVCFVADGAVSDAKSPAWGSPDE